VGFSISSNSVLENSTALPNGSLISSVQLPITTIDLLSGHRISRLSHLSWLLHLISRAISCWTLGVAFVCSLSEYSSSGLFQ
jgi:hypothetical protein